jgi:hypothetical protein
VGIPFAVVEIVPVRVVEIVPTRLLPIGSPEPDLVVEMVPAFVVEMVPAFVVEMVPVFAAVGVDTAKTNSAVKAMNLKLLICLGSLCLYLVGLAAYFVPRLHHR